MRTVQVELVINAPPDQVLDAFVDVEALRDWWSVDRGLIDAREGGVWGLAWDRSDKGFRYVISGRIGAYSHSRLVSISNLVYFNPDRAVLGPMHLIIVVEPVGDGTRLLLRQDGFGEGPDWDWYYETVHQSWPEVLGTLKIWLEQDTRAAGAN